MGVLLVAILLNAQGVEIKRSEQQLPSMEICRMAETAIASHLHPEVSSGRVKLKTDCRSITLASK